MTIAITGVAVPAGRAMPALTDSQVTHGLFGLLRRDAG
jgi:hypothetical protein